MSYSTYYLKSSAKVLSATEIKRKVGVDPSTYGAVGLATLGILTPVDTVQPFNTSLFDVTKTYTVSGTTATETYTAAAKSSLEEKKHMPDILKMMHKITDVQIEIENKYRETHE